MNLDVLWLAIGGFGFLFRAWAVEIKLEPELLYRRHYIDRFLSYYAFLAIMFNFEFTIFNLLLIFTLPSTIIAFFSLDLPFFIKFSKRTYWKDHIKVLWFERITLHLPGLILGVVLILKKTQETLISEDLLIQGMAVLILILFPLFSMDHRIRFNEAKPQRVIILIILAIEILSLVIFIIYNLINMG